MGHQRSLRNQFLAGQLSLLLGVVAVVVLAWPLLREHPYVRDTSRPPITDEQLEVAVERLH